MFSKKFLQNRLAKFTHFKRIYDVMQKPLYHPNKLLVIAGPCTLESAELCEEVAGTIAELQATYRDHIDFIFKTSFDKANRTCVHSARGVGLERGLEILSRIKKDFNLKVVTDIHLPQQAKKVGSVCDVVQIPAFLCRQTDLLEAAAQTGRVVNVKKGQFLSPYDMQFVVEKLRYYGAEEIWQTDRGTMFGYGTLVVDMRSFPIMQQNNAITIFDTTHSLQMPSCGKGFTGGDRQFAPALSQAALAAGANGLYLETHPNPAKALSDQSTQLPLKDLPKFLGKCLKVWKAVR